jgi:hypothetical protein
MDKTDDFYKNYNQSAGTCTDRFWTETGDSGLEAGNIEGVRETYWFVR